MCLWRFQAFVLTIACLASPDSACLQISVCVCVCVPQAVLFICCCCLNQTREPALVPVSLLHAQLECVLQGALRNIYACVFIGCFTLAGHVTLFTFLLKAYGFLLHLKIIKSKMFKSVPSKAAVLKEQREIIRSKSQTMHHKRLLRWRYKSTYYSTNMIFKKL